MYYTATATWNFSCCAISFNPEGANDPWCPTMVNENGFFDPYDVTGNINSKWGTCEEECNPFGIKDQIYWSKSSHEPLALDRRVVQKISKYRFLQDIKNSFYRVRQICLKPHQNFFHFFPNK